MYRSATICWDFTVEGTEYSVTFPDRWPLCPEVGKVMYPLDFIWLGPCINITQPGLMIPVNKSIFMNPPPLPIYPWIPYCYTLAFPSVNNCCKKMPKPWTSHTFTPHTLYSTLIAPCSSRVTRPNNPTSSRTLNLPIRPEGSSPNAAAARVFFFSCRAKIRSSTEFLTMIRKTATGFFWPVLCALCR